VNETIQILEDLQQHPGWRLFREHVDHEWGPRGVRYMSELEKALDLTDPGTAASQARQIVSARKVVDALMGWPTDELQRLKRAEQKPELTMSRRGGL
jgi:hypothetical protein